MNRIGILVLCAVLFATSCCIRAKLDFALAQATPARSGMEPSR